MTKRDASRWTDEEPSVAESSVLATLKTRAARAGYIAMLAAYEAQDMADVEVAIETGADPEPLRAFVSEHDLDWDLQWTRSEAEVIADDIARAVGYAVRARGMAQEAEECRRASLYDLAERREQSERTALLHGWQALRQAVKALHGAEQTAHLARTVGSVADLVIACERASMDLDSRVITA